MWSVLIIGLRNLRRRRLRSILTWSMIFVGTGLIVFSVGLAEGTYDDMIALATRSYSGHFQVVAESYHDKPSLFKNIKDPAKEAAALEKHPDVVAVTGRVETAGLLAAGNRTTGVMLIGVDPRQERRVTTLADAVTKGRWLEGSAAGSRLPIIIGEGVAQRLKVDLGGEVSFIGQAADGSIAADLFTVVGVIATGTDEIDGGMALIRLADAQELLVLGRRVHRLVGLATSLGVIETVKRETTLSNGLTFLTWQEVMPSLDQTIRGDRAGLWVFVFIMLAVVVLGVTNTMMMAVLERTREFGVMMALGTTPGRIVGVVLSEAAWITLIGVLSGLIVGVIANLITLKWGIRLLDEPITYGGVVIEVMRARNTFDGNVVFPFLIFVSGLVAGLAPALRAARLKPAQALRQT